MEKEEEEKEAEEKKIIWNGNMKRMYTAQAKSYRNYFTTRTSYGSITKE